jgi:hypothetical protein
MRLAQRGRRRDGIGRASLSLLPVLPAWARGCQAQPDAVDERRFDSNGRAVADLSDRSTERLAMPAMKDRYAAPAI